MGLSARSNYLKGKTSKAKAYKYVAEDAKKGRIVIANNPAHALQLLAEGSEKRIDKTKIVEINMENDDDKKKKKNKKS